MVTVTDDRFSDLEDRVKELERSYVKLNGKMNWILGILVGVGLFLSPLLSAVATKLIGN